MGLYSHGFITRVRGAVFGESAAQKRQMSPDVLARLFQQRSQIRLIRFDEQTVPRAAFNTMNPKLWKRFRTVISPKNDQEFLEKIKLIAKDGGSFLPPRTLNRAAVDPCRASGLLYPGRKSNTRGSDGGVEV